MSALETVLEAGGPAVERLMERVERRMETDTAHYGPALAR